MVFAPASKDHEYSDKNSVLKLVCVKSLTSGLYDMLIRKVGISFSIPGTNLQAVSSLRPEALNGRLVPLYTSDIFQLENSVASIVLKNLDIK